MTLTEIYESFRYHNQDATRLFAEGLVTLVTPYVKDANLVLQTPVWIEQDGKFQIGQYVDKPLFLTMDNRMIRLFTNNIPFTSYYYDRYDRHTPVRQFAYNKKPREVFIIAPITQTLEDIAKIITKMMKSYHRGVLDWAAKSLQSRTRAEAEQAKRNINNTNVNPTT